MKKWRSINIKGYFALCLLVASFVLTSSALAASSEKKVFNWRMQTVYSPTLIEQKEIIPAFVKEVKQMSGGRLNITIFPGGTLVPNVDMVPAVGKGMFEMAQSSMSYAAGLMPECLYSRAPMAARNADDLGSIWAATRDLFRASYAKQNVRILSLMQCTDSHVILTKPVKTLDDLKGMKIRTIGATALFFEGLGASTVYIPGGEVYTGLAVKTIDGATWGGDSTLYNWKWHEVAKYLLMSPAALVANPGDEMVVNLDAWNSLPPDLQAILQTAADKLHWVQRNTLLKEESKARQQMLDAGVTLCSLPDSDYPKVMKAAESVWADIASKSPEAKEVVKIMSDYLRSQGYTKFKIE